MEAQLIQQSLLEFQPRTSFTILNNGAVINLDFNEITHVSKYGNETVIHTQMTRYRTYHSLQEIINDLPVNDFFSINQKQVIALKYINGIKRKRIQVGDYFLWLTKEARRQLIGRIQKQLDEEYVFYDGNVIKRLPDHGVHL